MVFDGVLYEYVAACAKMSLIASACRELNCFYFLKNVAIPVKMYLIPLNCRFQAVQYEVAAVRLREERLEQQKCTLVPKSCKATLGEFYSMRTNCMYVIRYDFYSKLF